MAEVEIYQLTQKLVRFGPYSGADGGRLVDGYRHGFLGIINILVSPMQPMICPVPCHHQNRKRFVWIYKIHVRRTVEGFSGYFPLFSLVHDSLGRYWDSAMNTKMTNQLIDTLECGLGEIAPQLLDNRNFGEVRGILSSLKKLKKKYQGHLDVISELTLQVGEEALTLFTRENEELIVDDDDHPEENLPQGENSESSLGEEEADEREGEDDVDRALDRKISQDLEIEKLSKPFLARLLKYNTQGKASLLEFYENEKKIQRRLQPDKKTQQAILSDFPSFELAWKLFTRPYPKTAPRLITLASTTDES